MSLQQVDFSRESYPYFFYDKPLTNYGTQYVNFAIDYGFYFVLTKVNIAYPSQNLNLVGAYAEPLKIRLYSRSAAVSHNKPPADITLIASPAESGIVVDTAPGYNVNFPFTAVPLNWSKTLNIPYQFRDVLQVEISNYTTVASPSDPLNSLPAMVELLCMGRMYPIERAGV